VEEARQAAESANRSKDHFLAVLGHELRNPLTPILATLQQLRLQGSRSLINERRVVERQAKQLASMVDDLLDVSRITRGRVKLDRRRVELANIVSRAVESSRPELEQRGHRLLIGVAEGLIINVDETRLVQVVSNLLTNAAKYTPRGGNIEVTGERDGDDVVLRIRDDGIGIAAELLPRIFERFAQSTWTAERGQGGLGLGLSIVRNLVHLHGGTTTAASEGPGKGSEFTVRLPFSPAKATQRKLAALRKTRKPTANPQPILIVDDNRDIADVLARVLRARGHEVAVAYDGPAALELVKQFRPRYALLDIGLPSMDGYELARRLKQQLRRGSPVMVAFTGYAQSEDRRRARSAGFADHLVKPIDLEQLLSIVEKN
jgi:CheY-like chemotaxis protein